MNSWCPPIHPIPPLCPFAFLPHPIQLESIVNSIVTEQHTRAHAAGSKPMTFEDLFLIKLYTFAQWVQCVRYCGVTLQDAAGLAPAVRAESPAANAAMKLADVMKTPCSVCLLQSNWDSWFVLPLPLPLMMPPSMLSRVDQVRAVQRRHTCPW